VLEGTLGGDHAHTINSGKLFQDEAQAQPHSTKFGTCSSNGLDCPGAGHARRFENHLRAAFAEQSGTRRVLGVWLSGYYDGKRSNTVLDTQAVEKNGSKVMNYCRSHLNMTVMQAVESVLGAGK